MEPPNSITIMPLEVLTRIFSYLSRRDRFICMFMCQRWRDAMDVPCLWYHMSVKLDVDFFEVSTIQLTIEYCKFVKSLDLRFECPEEPMQWINYKMVDITKRAYRFLSIFVNKNLQISKLSFSNFCDFYRSKKILYYLSMFLRSQYMIKLISFNGSYFSKKALIKILTSSISANQSSIEYIDIQNSYYENDFHMPQPQANILKNQLMICISNMNSLVVLKIDFESLIKNDILEGFLEGKCNTLKFLDVRLAEHDLSNLTDTKLYQNSTWISMTRKFKELKVSFIFFNIVNDFEFFENILTRSLPIYCTTWISDSTILHELYMHCVKKYSHSIEILKIQTKSQILDDLIITAVQSCPRLKCLEFSGTIIDVDAVQEAMNENNFSGFTNYKIYVNVAKRNKNHLSKMKVFKKNFSNDKFKNFGLYEIN